MQVIRTGMDQAARVGTFVFPAVKREVSLAASVYYPPWCLMHLDGLMEKDGLTVGLSVKLTEALNMLAETVERFAAMQSIADSVSFKLNLVLDELITNSISYSLPYVAAPLLRLRLGCGPDRLMAQLEDNGVAFNPFSEAPVPDTTLAVEDRPVGGLGVHLVKQFADAFNYERDRGINRITLWLKLEGNQSEQ